ncbi:hypothetical protein DFH08DRAFT_804887 [Mycena albidolilacea]|uniref:Uncharacterized protein n=1 Tax=Mycena albidolilacea TaxID=1033008 RepID=A0AAD7EXM8_9AGAR|nr:hypothetical protein DFH08DRAFT_804887 [Mycena albidolilacea]
MSTNPGVYNHLPVQGSGHEELNSLFKNVHYHRSWVPKDYIGTSDDWIYQAMLVHEELNNKFPNRPLEENPSMVYYTAQGTGLAGDQKQSLGKKLNVPKSLRGATAVSAVPAVNPLTGVASAGPFPAFNYSISVAYGTSKKVPNFSGVTKPKQGTGSSGNLGTKSGMGGFGVNHTPSPSRSDRQDQDKRTYKEPTAAGDGGDGGDDDAGAEGGVEDSSGSGDK